VENWIKRGVDQMRYFDATGFPGRTVDWAIEKPPAADISMPLEKPFPPGALAPKLCSPQHSIADP
jgi:hypothetical protein